jgi:hypothetical protein
MRQVLLLTCALLVIVMALGACPTVDLGDTPVTPPLCRPNLDAFKMEGGIWDTAVNPPDATKSCVANEGCHAQATGSSALRLITKPRDQMLDSDWSTNLDVIGRYLNCATPANSEFVAKPQGEIGHLGGTIWVCDATCEPIMTVEAWIAAH